VAAKRYVGVSGFSYATWKGTFYPRDLKPEDFLTYYSKRLQTVEINSSFYAPPRSSVLKSWSDKTGSDFKFSFKAPRKITHISKLGEGSSEEALRFFKSVSSMGRKCGPILFQLPPFLKFDLPRLEGFLSRSSEIKDRVFEFRDPTWFQDSTYRALDSAGASLCVAETEEARPEIKVIGTRAYFRLRRDSYSDPDIASWSRVIREGTNECEECYAYLRHDETGKNALLARQLAISLNS
jgi:uncharacterized protein YecE (DUF72 family)